jgi:xanthine dehydrogenase accessory factor
MKKLFQKIIDHVQQGQSVVLATVIARTGSIPTSTQAKMLVFPDGSILGTIGGGKLEAEVIREAQRVLVNTTPQIVTIALTGAQIETEGLICGGQVEIFLEPFAPGTNLALLEAIVASYDDVQSTILATVLNPTLSQDSRKMIIHADGTTVGTIGGETITTQIAQAMRTYYTGHDVQESIALDLSEQTAQELGLLPETQFRVFLETVCPLPMAYLFGGGHIALHLSKILHLIGFEFVVIDDRTEFANPTRFPYAAACLVHNFEHVFAELPANLSNAYLIIVTRGHTCDLSVLEQAVRTNANYIGMIGSQRKVDMLLQRLREQGVPQAVLDAIHAPIGLNIGSDTPEEIAVSIAAELIQVRRSRL